MRAIAAVVTAAALALGPLTSAGAATKPRIGGPCKKIHQVEWIKGKRAQCTFVRTQGAKKGRLIWKALPPARTTLVVNPQPSASPTTDPSPTAAPSPTGP